MNDIQYTLFFLLLLRERGGEEERGEIVIEGGVACTVKRNILGTLNFLRGI